MKYDTILFDLDGTLTESGLGITRSVAYACERMGIRVPDQSVLDRFIGPPLVSSFMEFIGLDEAGALRATEVYRERYSEIGWRENRLYPGMAALLRELKARGAYLGIASAKPEEFVRCIAEHFGFERCFDAIVGVSMENTRADKTELLRQALPERFDPARAAMVGDRLYDMQAAKGLGLAAVGVLYGYGDRTELEASGADEIAESVASLRALLFPGEPCPRGRFITFEGTDGCGKSTQMKKAADYLSERGWDVITSREPGGCNVAEAIRDLVLSVSYKGMSSECEALLYAAARAEHVRQVILPALQAGKIVLCDRFLDSSFAYQGAGRELGADFIRQINRAAIGTVPDLTLLFNGDRSVSARRMRAGGWLDRIESERDDFFLRAERAFEELAANEPERIRTINSDRSIDEVFADVRAQLDALLG